MTHICEKCRTFDIAAWLAARGVNIALTLEADLRATFERAHDYTTLGAFCEAEGVKQSTFRFRCTKKNLPPPAAWFALARALHFTRALRDNPRDTVARVSYRAGYADHSAFTHTTRRLFGTTPTRARGTSEAELLDRWWSRQRLRRANRATAPRKASAA